VTLNLAETSVVKSRLSVPHGANLFNHVFESVLTSVPLVYVLQQQQACWLPRWAL